MFPDTLTRQAARLLNACRKGKLMIATAESCTGGLLAALLTQIPGSSDVFERGFVTYSNASKTQSLGVPAKLIAAQGAVSEKVAAAMAQGARKHSKADLAIAITGIAGPGGGTKQKPVGLVYIALNAAGKTFVEECFFKGDRQAIRMGAVRKALAMLTNRK